MMDRRMGNVEKVKTTSGKFDSWAVVKFKVKFKSVAVKAKKLAENILNYGLNLTFAMQFEVKNSKSNEKSLISWFQKL